MLNRYLPAKLFFGLAILSAIVGAAMFRRGLPAEFYLDPLFLLLLPRLMPFAVAILSACLGMIYYALERGLKRPLNSSLAIVHLASYMLMVFGYWIITHFWWRVLGEEQATNLRVPLWSVMLAIFAFGIGCLAFVLNLSLSMRTPRKAQ